MYSNANHITNLHQLRETVRRIVSERVYGMMNESIFEAEEDDEKDDKKDKETHKKKDKEIDALRNQVTDWLRQPEIDMAPIAAKLYPDMDDDTRRSLFSKQSRGEREFTDSQVLKVNQILRNV